MQHSTPPSLPAPSKAALAIVYTNAPNKDVARSIAHTLVEENLAACVNIIPGVESTYIWQGKIHSDEELLLLIKTRQAVVPEVTARIKKIHPYTVCEVLAVPIIGGSESYMKWVEENTSTNV